jgi:hypothetical protein
MPRKNPIPLSFLTYSPWGASRVFLKGRRLEDNEKEWLANVVCSGLVSINDIAHFYSIPARTLRSWTSAKDKNLPLPGKRGRAMRLPDDGTMVYTEELKSASKSNIKILYQDHKNNLQQLARGHTPLSISTIRRWDKKHKVVIANAEKTTVARQIATTDYRNALSWIVHCHYICNILKVREPLRLNVDATCITVGGKGGDISKVVYIRSRDRESSLGKEMKCMPDADDKNFTLYTVKLYLLINAIGNACDPIYILADSNMGPEEMDVHTVGNLGLSTELRNKEYVVFCKERSCKFYRWFITDVLVPWANDIRDVNGLPRDACCELAEDGEAKQIKVYEDPIIIELLKNNYIVIGKPPASTSAITQACDARGVFKGPKTVGRTINDRNVSDNEFMLKRLDSVFKDHNVWLNSEERGNLRLNGKVRKKRVYKLSYQSLVQSQESPENENQRVHQRSS